MKKASIPKFGCFNLILKAYLEVVNYLSKISNPEKSYDLKSQQVEALSRSVNISDGLFKSFIATGCLVTVEFNTSLWSFCCNL